jgi:predicted transcriptional regulator
MTDHSSQSPCDCVLWILTEHGGQMERSRLRRHAGMRYAFFDPILEELVREGKIRIEEGMITLIGR